MSPSSGASCKPPVQLGPAPRRVRSRRPELWFPRLALLPHVLAGLLMLSFALLRVLCAIAGADAPGAVVGTSLRVAKGHPIYEVQFEYRVAGTTYDDSLDVDEATYDRYTAVQTEAERSVTVRHYTLGPLRWAGVPELRPMWDGIGPLAFFAVVWNVFTAAICAQLWVKPWRTRQLYIWGKLATGTITELWTVRGKHTTYYARYEFLDGSGRAQQRKLEVDEASWSHASVGQRVTVLFSPGKPGQSTVYELGGFAVEPA